MNPPRLIVRELGTLAYRESWAAMRDFTDRRGPEQADELWLLEHPPVFTQGLAGRPEHLLDAGDIPVVQTDRGGQITYHGPGQLVAYPLLDLNRLGIGIRTLVRRIEQAIIELLAEFELAAETRDGAPGVYIDGAKIASIGMKVRRGCTYHGLALNLSLELAPFQRINPCGYAGQPMTRLLDLAPGFDAVEVGRGLAARLAGLLALDWTLASGDDGLDERIRLQHET